MAVRQMPNRMVMETDDTAWMELQADAETDLQDLEAFDGITIAFGSLCHVIGTGDLWALNSDGEWKNQTTPEGA